MTRLALALLIAALSGCASMSGGQPVQTISVQTVKNHQEVADAGCILSNGSGRWFVTTPGRVTVNKNFDSLTVECSKEDVGSGREVIASKFNIGLLGNAVLGGPIGYMIDHKSGAGYDYPQTVVVVLKEKESPQGEIAPAPQPIQAETRIPPTSAEVSPPTTATARASAQAATPLVVPPVRSPAPVPEPVWQSAAPEIAPAQPQASTPQPPNTPASVTIEQAPAPSVQPAQVGQAATNEQPAWQPPSSQPETHYYQPY